MALDLTALQSEITNDPLALGYAGKTDSQKALLLNASNNAYSKSVPQVPISQVLIWGASTGALDKLNAGLTNASAGVRAICRAALILLQAPAVTILDLSLSANIGMLSALVTAGVLSSSDQTSLVALTAISPASRAEVLFGAGTVVSEQNIGQARNGA